MITSTIPKVRLYPDTYSLTVHFADNNTKEKYEMISQICKFEVKVLGELRDYYWNRGQAIYTEETNWEIKKIN